MSGRREEYRRLDGIWSRQRRDAIVVDHASVTAATAHASPQIPPSYWWGTAMHESSLAINERDTEVGGFQSWGIFQVSREEARGVSLPASDDYLLSLDGNARVMVRLAERHLAVLESTARLAAAAGRPFVASDMPAYLAIAHNQGVAAAVKTIKAHGIDWDSYRRRNPTLRIVSSGYGDHVLSPVSPGPGRIA